MLIPKVVSDMVRDRGLTPADLRVWLSVADHLDVVEFRPLKLEIVANDVHASKALVFACLNNLVGRGYLERGQRDGQRGAVTYRIPLSRIYPRETAKAA